MTLAHLMRQRDRIAVMLSTVVLAIYFGFILLVAFNKPLLATLLVPGLSLGILLGMLVILAAWLTTWIYVRWANQHMDSQIRRLRDEGASA